MQRLVRTVLLVALTAGAGACAQADDARDWPAEGRRLGQQLVGQGATTTETACRQAVMRYVEDEDGPQSPANRGAMRAACQAVRPASPPPGQPRQAGRAVTTVLDSKLRVAGSKVPPQVTSTSRTGPPVANSAARSRSVFGACRTSLTV